MSEARGRWRQLALLGAAQFLAMSVWFAAGVAAPALRERLALTVGEAAWLTSAVQFGFVAGTLVSALLNLADLLPSRRFVAVSAVAAALANAALLATESFSGALTTRLLTGMALAGVYPPAMKMAATWFKAGRGLAIGTVVGALTAGKALPYLLGGVRLPFDTVVLIPSAAALLAAVLIAVGYRDGPHAYPARPFSWRLAGTVARDPALRRITGGYLGHMWELYAFWAWVPAFLAASFAARAPGTDAGIWPFAAVAIGVLGAVWGGSAADRIGRERVVRTALWISGGCCLLSSLVFGGSPVVVIAVVLVWGVAVIADSAQFSALVTETAPPHAVGTALTLQVALGFLLTIVTIQGVPMVAEWVGWRWAMVPLAFGPMAGLLLRYRFPAMAEKIS